MENVMGELQVILNDLDPDPSLLLGGEARVGAGDRAHGTQHRLRARPARARGVAACAWLLSLYRRRSESVMRRRSTRPRRRRAPTS